MKTLIILLLVSATSGKIATVAFKGMFEWSQARDFFAIDVSVR